MTTGYYKMHRGWMDAEVFDKEPFTQAQAWCWMIDEAEWKDTTRNILGKPVLLKRGQFSDSIRFMAEKFQWSKSRLEYFLGKLRKFGMIETDNRTGQLIVTVCNYSKYQDHQDTNRTASETATGHEQDKQEEIKQERKKEGESVARATASPAAEPDPAFEQFWTAYPKQRAGSKAKALKAWSRAISQGRATAEQIQQAVEQYRHSDEVQRGYAKGCEAWLNDDRWTVDYGAKPQPTPPRPTQPQQKKPDYYEEIVNGSRDALRNIAKGQP